VAKLSAWPLSMERGRGEQGARAAYRASLYVVLVVQRKLPGNTIPLGIRSRQQATRLPLLVACALSGWPGGMHGHDVRYGDGRRSTRLQTCTSMPGTAADAALCTSVC
jgi:hypothetical protein